MSTYNIPAVETTIETDAFVPSYARGPRRRKPVRTWMILAPIGALALIGGGAVMMMSGEPAGAPLAEPQPALVQPLAPTPGLVESSSLPDNASISVAASTPVVAEAPPAPPPAVQRRQPAPVERRAEPVAVAPRVETATELTGPQPYVAPATTAPTVAPPAPAIPVAPLS